MAISISAVFLVNALLPFYFLFEFSLVPITWLILGWGYQPERIPAAYALLLYTVTCSLPLLILIVLFLNQVAPSLSISVRKTRFSPAAKWLTLFLIAAFLVKLPIFGLHMWLPMAHVEAPVFASIILAALLLKLGGYALVRLSGAIPIQELSQLIIPVSLAGGVIISFICLAQRDIKVVIAYSSVAHMAFVAGAIFSQRELALRAAYIIIFAHGISSSAMFAGANILYIKNHTRNLGIFSRGLVISPALTFLWFFACLGNIGTPPTINFLAEVARVNSLVNYEVLTAVVLAALIFLAAGYSLVLYASRQQGQNSKLKFRALRITPKDLVLILNHITWLFLLIIIFIYHNTRAHGHHHPSPLSYLVSSGNQVSTKNGGGLRKSCPFWVRVSTPGPTSSSFLFTLFFNHPYFFSLWYWVNPNLSISFAAFNSFHVTYSISYYRNSTLARIVYRMVPRNIWVRLL